MNNENHREAEQCNQNSTISKPLLRLKLLDSLRHGDFSKLSQLLTSKDFEPLDNADVQEVVQLTLHYAVQVAPFTLTREIVANWIPERPNATHSSLVVLDINKQDSDGNTPLHLAALQSRSDVVQLLMSHPQINDCILNNSHLQAIEMCKNLNIAQAMQISRANYVGEIAHEFRLAFNNRDFAHLESILSNPRNAELLDINGNDPETGDTVLHEFVKKRDVIMVRWIIDHGGDPFKRDKRGRLPINSFGKGPSDKDHTVSENTKSAVDNEIRQLLEKAAREQSVIDVTNKLHELPSYKGYLRKWTNFAQGYKLRWFILSSDGTLSYYKDQDDSINACRGSLNMSTCYLHLDSSEKLKFEIIGGSNGTVRWHLKGNHPIETNKWVWAIQSAIRTAKDREIMVRASSNSGMHDQSVPAKTQQLSVNTAGVKTHNSPTSAAVSFGVNDASSNNARNQQLGSLVRSNSGSSVSSSDVELNDNLTDSGKQYVTKVKQNRLHVGIPGASNVQPQSGIDAYIQKPFAQNFLAEDSNLSPVTLAFSNNSLTSKLEDDYEDNEDEGEEGDEEDVLDRGSQGGFQNDEDEDLKVNYGPFAQELSILQRSIIIEITALNELLDDCGSVTSILPTAKRSLHTISKNFAQLNKLADKRDQRLVKMLSKQRDINNLWIKSVKELEMELIEKSEKLAAMDNDKKSLKKMLQKKLSEVAVVSESNSDGTNYSEVEHTRESTKQFAEIVEFIKCNQSSDEDDSDIDEFFDAEDPDKIDQSASLVSFSQHLTSVRSSMTPLPPSQSQKLAIDLITKDLTTPRDLAGKIPAETSATESGQAEVGRTVSVPPAMESTQVIQEISANTGVTESVTKCPPTTAVDHLHGGQVPVTDVQRVAQYMIDSEGTYLGYEDGVRKKLNLDKDERPKINLWSVLKSMIGKDMTRMNLPVTFNEPTSLLQRVGEDLEYSDLLDAAATFEDSTLRLLYVAAFLSSSHSSTIKRVAKPFNPLLGETFEYARPDKNYRLFTEQVSHHPPISATWTESPKWDFFGESYVDSKFYGRSFDIKHLGLWYLRLRPDNNDPEELYTWKKPNNSVIGILIGKPEVDNHGDVKVTNHTTGDYCLLHFKARGWRSANAFEVRGEVYDANDVKKWVLGGHWNDAIYAKRVMKNNATEDLNLDRVKRRRSITSAGPSYDGHKFMVWHINERPDSPFNLTSFAITLNAPQPSLMPWIAPTDSRRRPDQRAMEDGRYDEAAEEKRRVEDKQRQARRQREAENIVYQPRWFKKTTHPVTGQPYWEFNGEYWKLRKQRQLVTLPDIF
ncbi:HBR192Wp [Eremothecium sinecaudum]|uniref:HBR192Wp n=1 Tax=Eremothecium sinecaudum TaxID=45286 RepID=A0A109UX01_9SACH|nr:HBR192Wp [Eremothecium sinecaudum]AMD19093.1 HBR192Wp [Eremothecium sinecaudum]